MAAYYSLGMGNTAGCWVDQLDNNMI